MKVWGKAGIIVLAAMLGACAIAPSMTTQVAAVLIMIDGLDGLTGSLTMVALVSVAAVTGIHN